MKKTLDWYLKWTATVVLIFGTAINSLGFYPAGPIVLCIGGAIWSVVSIRWGEASLIVTNLVMLLTGVAGLIWAFYR